MTSRWDDEAMQMLRAMAGDLTALDAAVEVLKTTTPSNRMLVLVDDLVKQCLTRQLDLLAHLKG
ncbi:MAG: hypothetical protein M3Z11_03445 [Candidatus Dormibacteraeota bacterium]|nr:hypothetical protein [Candidatus Dormibacteraeota bacterium]